MSTEIIKQEDSAKLILAKAKKPGTLAGLKHTEIQVVFEKMQEQIGRALPKHLNPERIIQVVSNMISRNPMLAECTADSMFGAVMQSSILGFIPAEALGYCYFVPYNNNKTGKKEVQFQIGYKGYMSLARRSGKINEIYAETVYASDLFEVKYGLEHDIKHVPDMDIDRTGDNFKYVYAVCKYNDGTSNFVVLNKLEVDKYRMRSPMQQKAVNGAWRTDFAAMAKKTAIRRLATWMPLDDSSMLQTLTDGAVLNPAKIYSDGYDVSEIENAEYEEVPETITTLSPDEINANELHFQELLKKENGN